MSIVPENGNINIPVIAGVEITTDEHGRFNLNALHRASGGEKKDAPNEWLRTKQAGSLIAELNSQTGDSRFGSVETIRGGNAPGTFAHELLAISYAGWISPSFQLTVNQAFIDRRTGGTPNPDAVTRIDMARMIIESEEERIALQIENQQQACRIVNLTPKAEAFDNFLDADGVVNLRMAMREIKAKPNLAIKHLKDAKHTFSEGKNGNTPKAHLVSRGYFIVGPSKPNQEGKTYPQTFVTPRGVAWLDAVIPDELRIGGAA